jgi:hypothetical protein
MNGSSILKIFGAGAVAAASLFVAGTVMADSRRCLAEQSGPGWRVRVTSLYGDAGLQGSAMVIDLWAPAQGLPPGSNLQFNTIIASHDPALGWIRIWSLQSDPGHVAVDIASPEVYSVNASMLAGIDGKDSAPILKTSLKVLADGKPVFSGAPQVVKPPADFHTSAARVAQLKLGDFRGKDYHDAEATELSMAIFQAGAVRVETHAEDGQLVGSFDLPRSTVQAAMAARAAVRGDIERKLAAGGCETLKPNL